MLPQTNNNPVFPKHFSGATPVKFNSSPLKNDGKTKSMIFSLWGLATFLGRTVKFSWGGTLPETNVAPENGWLEDDRFREGNIWNMELDISTCSFQGGYLLGGWTNPSEKYARQNGNLPQIGMKIKNIWKYHLDILISGKLSPSPTSISPNFSGLNGVSPCQLPHPEIGSPGDFCGKKLTPFYVVNLMLNQTASSSIYGNSI